MSGICKYSREFYSLVLEPKGFIFIDSAEHLSTIFTRISSRDYVHIEIGIFQKKEIEIFCLMVKAKYRHLSVTLHDPPLLKYPFFDFGNRYLNMLSKIYDRFISGHFNAAYYLKRAKSVFVLTQKGVAVTKQVYGIDNVYYLPHVAMPDTAGLPNQQNTNLLYFGFIGKNKGIEYSLKLHRHLLKVNESLQFYIIGTAMGNQLKFYDYLKNKYQKNVQYLGYLDEAQLAAVFEKAAFALLMFNEYRFFHPVSGSILQSLSKGKVVLSNNVNSVGEILTDNENGFLLSGNIPTDASRMLELIDNRERIAQIQERGFQYLRINHSPQKVAAAFFKTFSFAQRAVHAEQH